jgi:hypothetical protein
MAAAATAARRSPSRYVANAVLLIAALIGVFRAMWILASAAWSGNIPVQRGKPRSTGPSMFVEPGSPGLNRPALRA